MTKLFKRLLIVVLVLVVAFFLWTAYTVGLLAPLIPFYNYYGVDPPNDSWKSCKGTIYHMNGSVTSSENMQKFDYWTVRALKERNLSLCRNVGIYEGGDVIHQDEHKHAIDVCEYILENNPSFVDQCDGAF